MTKVRSTDDHEVVGVVHVHGIEQARRQDAVFGSPRLVSRRHINCQILQLESADIEALEEARGEMLKPRRGDDDWT